MQNIQDTIDQLKQTITSLEALQELTEPAKGWYEPKDDEVFWCLDEEGVESIRWDDSAYDGRIAERQQLFRTKEEAEEADKRRRAETTIKRWIAEHCDWKPDWTDFGQKKWFVAYNHDTSMLDYVYKTYHESLDYYFPSEELAKQCVEECRDEWGVIYGIRSN